jgi:hypothetical protein
MTTDGRIADAKTIMLLPWAALRGPVLSCTIAVATPTPRSWTGRSDPRRPQARLN